MSQSAQEHREQAPDTIRCAVVTVSDTRDESNDKSGELIKDRLTAEGHQITDYRIVRDEPELIGELLDQLASRDDCDAIIMNGGTGISRRDNTFDVVSSRLEQHLSGFGEIFRVLSYEEIGAAAMLSRATAGVYQNTIVILTPGSSNAVKLAMDKLIVPELAHLVFEIRK